MRTRPFYLWGLIWGLFLLLSALSLGFVLAFMPGLRLWALAFLGILSALLLAAKVIQEQLGYRRADARRTADNDAAEVFD